MLLSLQACGAFRSPARIQSRRPVFHTHSRSMPTPSAKENPADGAEILLNFLTRAAAAQAASYGADNLRALRVFASAFGAGDELAAVENSVRQQIDDGSGVASIGESLAGALGTKLRNVLESPRSRAVALWRSVAMAVVVSELAQLGVVATLAWLLTPARRGALVAARATALASREYTRPLRLAAEFALARRFRREQLALPPRARAEHAVRMLLGPAAAVAAGWCAMAWLEGLLGRSAAAAAASSYGLLCLPSPPLPPAVLPLRTAARLAAPLLGALPAALSSRLSPTALTAAALRLVEAAQSLGELAVSAAGVLAAWARTVKPLRAALDLVETDAWLADGLVALGARLFGAGVPPPSGSLLQF